MTAYFRVHPSIAMARVGSSKQYYLAPETAYSCLSRWVTTSN